MKRLSNEEAKRIQPILARAVQAQLDRWEAEREIEGYFDKESDHMQEGIEHLAVGYDAGIDVTLEDVKDYIEGIYD